MLHIHRSKEINSAAHTTSCKTKLLVLLSFLLVIIIFQAMALSSKNQNVVGKQRRVAVIGASLGGLSAANALVQLGHIVHVYERAKGPMHNKGYGMGFVDVDLWERLVGRRMIRRGQRANRGQGAFYYGDLWKFLYDGLPKGTVRFGSTVNSLGSSKKEAMRQPTIGKEKYDLAVLADGGWSALRHYITDKKTKIQRVCHLGWSRRRR